MSGGVRMGGRKEVQGEGGTNWKERGQPKKKFEKEKTKTDDSTKGKTRKESFCLFFPPRTVRQLFFPSSSLHPYLEISSLPYSEISAELFSLLRFLLLQPDFLSSFTSPPSLPHTPYLLQFISRLASHILKILFLVSLPSLSKF